jgi:hypothetical protein
VASSATAILSDEPAPLTGVRLFAAAFALALANFVVVLDTTIANVSVPHIAGGLAVSPTQGTWVITSYAVADAISVPLTGWLAMRFGTVRWFLYSIVGFGIFSFLCGISQTLDGLIVFRILQGLSGGPLMPLSQILLLRIFPKEKAGIGLAIWDPRRADQRQLELAVDLFHQPAGGRALLLWRREPAAAVRDEEGQGADRHGRADPAGAVGRRLPVDARHRPRA